MAEKKSNYRVALDGTRDESPLFYIFAVFLTAGVILGVLSIMVKVLV